MLICRCFLLHKDIGNCAELALLTYFVLLLFLNFLFVWLLHLLVSKTAYYPRGAICLFCICMTYHHGIWHSWPWRVRWHTLVVWCDRVALQFLDAPRCRIKEAAIQGALHCSSGNGNWWWFGEAGEECNEAFGLLQKGSVWSVFVKSIFSHVTQSENAILIAHFSWVGIWSSCLRAATGLAPKSVIPHLWSVIGVTFSLMFSAH